MRYYLCWSNNFILLFLSFFFWNCGSVCNLRLLFINIWPTFCCFYVFNTYPKSESMIRKRVNTSYTSIYKCKDLKLRNSWDSSFKSSYSIPTITGIIDNPSCSFARTNIFSSSIYISICVLARQISPACVSSICLSVPRHPLSIALVSPILSIAPLESRECVYRNAGSIGGGGGYESTPTRFHDS